MVVPQLDHQVFTPGPARDYAAHAIQIAQQFPDYAKKFQEARAAEMARQQALLKYQTDLQKAQAFIDMYPDYRAAQIAQLRARAAQAQAIADTTPGYRDAQIMKLKSQAQMYGDTPDKGHMNNINTTYKAPPLGGGGEGGSEATDTAPPVPAQPVDTDTMYNLNPY